MIPCGGTCRSPTTYRARRQDLHEGRRDLQDIETLGYTYDDLPKPDNLQVTPPRAEARRTIRRRDERRTDAVQLDGDRERHSSSSERAVHARKQRPGNRPRSNNPNSASREVVAIISQIKISDDVRAIRVFVNLDSLDQNMPNSDPHYVTTLSFLKHNMSGGMCHMALPSTIVDLTDTLRRLSLTEGPINSDKITIQLLPVLAPGAPSGAVGEVTPASIEIALV